MHEHTYIQTYYTNDTTDNKVNLQDCDVRWLALKFDDDFAAATGTRLLSLRRWVLCHETILIVYFDRFSSEVILLNVGHHLSQLLLIHVFTDVEEKVGTLFIDLVFIDLLAIEVIVAVPLLLEWVPRVTDIVAEAQLAVVVHDAVQVVRWLNVQVLFDELRI